MTEAPGAVASVVVSEITGRLRTVSWPVVIREKFA